MLRRYGELCRRDRVLRGHIDLDQRKTRSSHTMLLKGATKGRAGGAPLARLEGTHFATSPRPVERGPVTLLAIQLESFMRTFNPLVLLILLAMQSASTQAADLNGAWTIDASACDKMFTKKNDKLAFKQDADLHAGGLIVQGKQITGTFQKCTV